MQVHSLKLDLSMASSKVWPGSEVDATQVGLGSGFQHIARLQLLIDITKLPDNILAVYHMHTLITVRLLFILTN